MPTPGVRSKRACQKSCGHSTASPAADELLERRRRRGCGSWSAGAPALRPRRPPTSRRRRTLVLAALVRSRPRSRPASWPRCSGSSKTACTRHLLSRARHCTSPPACTASPCPDVPTNTPCACECCAGLAQHGSARHDSARLSSAQLLRRCDAMRMHAHATRREATRCDARQGDVI